MEKQVISFLLLSIILLTSCFEGPAQTNDWATVRALGNIRA
jgi:hypothetical protein